jgi:hypothetical protein
MAQPMGGDLPYPKRPASGPEPKVERAVGERLARVSRNTNCDPANAIRIAVRILVKSTQIDDLATNCPGAG